MKKVAKYFFKINTAACLVKTEGTIHRVSLYPENKQAPVFLDQIADFVAFEHQMETALQKTGFKSGLFRKNVAIVGVNINGTASRVKDLFVSFDHIGFDETYIVSEHLALLFALLGEAYRSSFLNVYLGSERIDVCLIENGIIVEKLGITYSKPVLDKVVARADTASSLQATILDCVETLMPLSTTPQSLQCILFGERLGDLPLEQELSNRLGVPVVVVPDYQEKILQGMERIAAVEDFATQLLGKRASL